MVILNQGLTVVGHVHFLRDNIHCCRPMVLAQQSYNGQANVAGTCNGNLIILHNKLLLQFSLRISFKFSLCLCNHPDRPHPVIYSPCPSRHTLNVLKIIFQSTQKLRSLTYFTSRFIHSSKVRSLRCGAICQ